MTIDYLFLYSSIVTTVVAQLLLKIAADENNGKGLLNSNLFLGYSLLVISLILNVLGLRSVPLHHMTFILPVTFILIPLSSMVFLRERQGDKFWVGSLFVVLGVFFFNIT
tara:strand:+ start:35 stop:364 length:330 start_codon:yes stop_codon:yes gene_type:complete